MAAVTTVVAPTVVTKRRAIDELKENVRNWKRQRQELKDSIKKQVTKLDSDIKEARSAIESIKQCDELQSKLNSMEENVVYLLDPQPYFPGLDSDELIDELIALFASKSKSDENKESKAAEDDDDDDATKYVKMIKNATTEVGVVSLKYFVTTEYVQSCRGYGGIDGDYIVDGDELCHDNWFKLHTETEEPDDRQQWINEPPLKEGDIVDEDAVQNAKWNGDHKAMRLRGHVLVPCLTVIKRKDDDDGDNDNDSNGDKVASVKSTTLK